ncbi:MAG: serpin family protein, partial [Calditrichaeota bacterium]
MKFLNIFYLVAVLLFISSCEKIYSPLEVSTRRTITLEESTLISAGNSFGVKFFREASTASTDSNVFVSPLSVSMALGMTLNGAREETREAMLQTLELEGLRQQQINESYQSLIDLLTHLDPKVIFGIANSIFYRQGIPFKQYFLDVNREYFDATLQPLNFNDPASVDIINQWVSDNTSDRIKKIIQSLDPTDIMVLLNAIYFKGDWTYQFSKEDTKEDDFVCSDGTTLKCDFMYQANDFQYLNGADFQAVELPYGNGDFRMAVILPDAGVDVNLFISNIIDEKLNSWLQSFSVAAGTIALPKFKLEFGLELKDLLTQLGMGIAFDPYGADFRDIYEGPENAFISSVKHKTFIQVDEEGTEAAAVTSVT